MLSRLDFWFGGFFAPKGNPPSWPLLLSRRGGLTQPPTPAFICSLQASRACSRLFPEEKKGSHTKISH